MKLKTLKDLPLKKVKEKAWWEGMETTKQSIRQEAIKWIKEIRCFINNPDEFRNIKSHHKSLGYSYTERDIFLLKKWIKHFFNIKEKDLK